MTRARISHTSLTERSEPFLCPNLRASEHNAARSSNDMAGRATIRPRGACSTFQAVEIIARSPRRLPGKTLNLSTMFASLLRCGFSFSPNLDNFHMYSAA